MTSDEFTNSNGQRITLAIDENGKLVITLPRMIIEPVPDFDSDFFDEQEPTGSLFDMSAFGCDEPEVDGE